MLIAHILADFCAVSKLSSETFPVNTTLPSSIGICPDMNSKFPAFIAGTYVPAGVGGVGNVIPKLASFSSLKDIVQSPV